MAFDFELRFSGLNIFTFPTQSNPASCTVLMVRTDHHMAHAPALAYEPRFLTSVPAGWRHDLVASPSDRPFARHVLESEVLSLDASFRNADEGSFVCVGGSTDNSFEHVPSLSTVEPRVVAPDPVDPNAGIDPRAFEDPITIGNPIVVGRFEIANGTLETAKKTDEDYWFRSTSGSYGSSLGTARKIASVVQLTLKNATEVRIRSDRIADPLVFRGAAIISASLTNEPQRYNHPSTTHLKHFGMLYKAMRWKDGSPPTAADLRIPHVSSGSPHSIGDDGCPGGRP